MARYDVPGLYVDQAERPPARGPATGVPAFLGWAPEGPALAPEEVTRWAGFARRFLVPPEHGHEGRSVLAALARTRQDPHAGALPHAVRGFFLNGGRRCLVLRLARPADPASEAGWVDAVREGLRTLEAREEPDLVCLPDAAFPPMAQAMGAEAARRAGLAMQRAVVEHCERLGNRFALLDSLPLPGGGTPTERARALAAQAGALQSASAALYHPWLATAPDAELDAATSPAAVPPCGHVAGIVARVDRETGVHRAPANVEVQGVLDLVPGVSETDHQEIVPQVNCLRAFPRRGIVVWGARTLAADDDAAWRYVPVRRLFLAIARWLDRVLQSVAFEPNSPSLWNRVARETTAYLNELYRAGALQGASAQDAFHVRCDSVTNPPESVELGRVVTEIGVAARAPSEFVVVRLTHGGGGTTLSGPLPG